MEKLASGALVTCIPSGSRWCHISTHNLLYISSDNGLVYIHYLVVLLTRVEEINFSENVIKTQKNSYKNMNKPDNCMRAYVHFYLKLFSLPWLKT